MLTAIQANWYWNYFQQNRWRFMQRTATAAPPGNDITTWDLPRIFAEIDKQFTQGPQPCGRIESDADRHVRRPVGKRDHAGHATARRCTTSWPTMRCRSTTPANRPPPRPRMPSSCRPIARSSLDVDEFLAWNIKTTDETSVIVKALRLYQDLLKFHQDDKDPTALLDARSGAAELRPQPCRWAKRKTLATRRL